MGVAAVALATVMLTLPGAKRSGRGGSVVSYLPHAVMVEASEAAPRAEALKLVTEDRSEPMGKQAQVEIPDQLRHYSDTRRFLAIQVAEWREHEIETPHDYAELASLIRAGELTEAPSVSENFVLYGVGGLANKDRFQHYDKSEGEYVALLNEAELESEYASIDAEAESVGAELAGLKEEMKNLDGKERSRRRSLERQASEHERTLEGLRERRERLEEFYADEERRAHLSAEREALEELARDFHGRAYNLADERARQAMKVRMLSHLRPEALAVLNEIAASYREKFGRPLPVTSLVRPDEYQRRLGKVNANATRIDTPPHSTGLAFDILYRYMTAEEQAHVMSDIARLRDEGRVEALRENRNHYHVFAFLDGRRPGEDLISRSLGHSVAAKVLRASAKEPREPKASAAKREKTASRKTKSAKAERVRRAAKAPSKKSASRAKARRGR